MFFSQVRRQKSIYTDFLAREQHSCDIPQPSLHLVLHCKMGEPDAKRAKTDDNGTGADGDVKPVRLFHNFSFVLSFIL